MNSTSDPERQRALEAVEALSWKAVASWLPEGVVVRGKQIPEAAKGAIADLLLAWSGAAERSGRLAGLREAGNLLRDMSDWRDAWHQIKERADALEAEGKEGGGAT